jgi:phosphoribosyl 1,2-cyclic phosphate phosphodiesterase
VRYESDYHVNGNRWRKLVPVFGCDCAACRRARLQENYRRRPCSAVVKFNDAVTLLDAGIPHLMDDWPAGSFQQFLLTHYHMDHVQGFSPALGRGRDDPGLRSAG